MTRKYFISLANALKDTNASLATIEAVADVCASVNGNFDRQRFIYATGGKETPGAPAKDMRKMKLFDLANILENITCNVSDPAHHPDPDARKGLSTWPDSLRTIARTL